MPSTRRQFLAVASGVSAVGVAGCLGSGSPYSPGADGDSEWPMPGYDARNSGWNPDAAAPRDGVTVRWERHLPGKPTGQPVVAAGLALVPTWDGLAAYDVVDGSVQWQRPDHRSPASPAVVGNTVFASRGVVQDEPGVVALDVADGSERWRRETRDDVAVPPRPLPDSGNSARAIYVGDQRGRLYQLAPDDGTVEATVGVFGSITAIALSLMDDVYVGTGSAEVYEFGTVGDSLQGYWHRQYGGKIAELAIQANDAYVAPFGSPVVRAQPGAHAGSPRWTTDENEQTVAVTDADVVTGGFGGLAVRKAHSGETRWRIEREIQARPAIAGDLVVAGGGELGTNGHGFVAAYDLRGDLTSEFLGRARWTFDTDDAVIGGISVADGAVFAATQGVDGDPRLYALEAA